MQGYKRHTQRRQVVAGVTVDAVADAGVEAEAEPNGP